MSEGARELQDRTQIGLPEATDEMLKELVRETPWFKAEQDAYRVAIAVALARGLDPKVSESDTGYGTKFHVAGLDPDGKLRLLVETFAPEHAATPYRWAMRLANKGVLYLHSALIGKGLSLTEALGLTEQKC